MRLLTKASRLKVQEADFSTLEAQGYSRENYKDLIFWLRTATTGNAGRIVYTLKVYKANAAHALEYKAYSTEERRAQVIANYKANHDRRQAYKAEVKAKGKPQSNQAQAAQAIREELKANFPNIKFSVTSEGYSMGDNVNVKWADGPTEEQVETLVNKYQAGNFNGMEDIYEYSENPKNLPRTKYLFCTRLMSENTKAVITAAMLEIFPGESWEEERDRDRETRKIWNRSPLPAGAIVTGIQRGDAANSWTEAITYTAPEQEESTEAPVYQAQEVTPGTVQIIEYSEKAIAVIGDTKAIKEALKSLGGRFNFRLTCGPGWIFKKSDLNKVTQALSSQAPDPDSIPEDLTREEAEQIAQEARHPEVEARHPLNICDPESTQYKEALKEYNQASKPSAADQMQAAADKLQKMAIEHRAKMQTKSKEIAQEVEKIRQLIPAPLYSETRQGSNTGRAQQAFLF